MTFSDLIGKHVLVVDDDYHRASETVLSLEDQGSEIVGPYPNVPEAIEVINHAVVDAAVVSVRVQLAGVVSLADRLLAHRIPFVLITENDEPQLLQRFGKVPVLKEPLKQEQMVIALAVAVAQSATRH